MAPVILCIGTSIIALIVARRWSLTAALIWVYLPVLMWVPLYFDFGIGGTAINPSTLVAVVLSIMAFKTRYYWWRFSIMDLWLVLYALSMFYADARRHSVKVGLYAMAGVILECVMPYIVGKILIEQSGSRERVAKMLVLCLAGVALISLYEFRMTYNVFQTITERLTHHQVEWIRQRRWGFARVAGPYAHAISAGMVFTIGVMLQLWLLATKGWESGRQLSARSTTKLRRKIFAVSALVAFGLFMTQSRGPWMGCSLGLIVAGVGLTRNRGRSAIIAVILLAVSISTFYTILDAYTNVPEGTNPETASVEQRDAIYRRELLTTYTPLVKEGGMWGWGNPAPTSNGVGAYDLNQPSIDNEFLRVTVAQGYAGITVFLLLIGTSVATLIRYCVVFRRREDIIFAFVLLGVIVATSFSLTTVYLGQPTMEFLFFFFGWAAALRPTRVGSQKVQVAAAPRFAFEKVFA